MATAAEQGTSAPAPRASRGAIAMTVVGGLLTIAALVLWAIATVTIDDAATQVIGSGFDVRRGLDVEVEVPGEVEVELEAGPHSVFAIVPDPDAGPTTSTPFGRDPLLIVTVTGPDGETVPVRRITSGMRFPDVPTDTILTVVADFEVDRAGTHTVGVEPASGAAPVEQAGVGPEVAIEEAFGHGLRGGLLLLVGIMVGGVGVVLLLGGFIWLLVSRSTPPPPPPPRYGPPPGPWGPPPGPWGPPSGSWGPPPPPSWGPPPPGSWGPPPPPGGWGPPS